MELNKVYAFKSEFCKELKIPMNQVERRLPELLEWLTNFFEYEFMEGHPNRIIIKEIIGEYQPLPRKKINQEKLTQEKIATYEQYTKEHFTKTYTPNSKAKVAREAMNDFGTEQYGHSNIEAVVKRYVKEPFERYGETDNKQIWVYYSTYTPLSEDVVREWRNILRAEKIGEQEAANAFYRYAYNEDISLELNYYKNAMSIFQAKYNDIPILVKSWRLKVDK